MNNKTIVKFKTLYFPAMGGTLASTIQSPENKKMPFNPTFYNPKNDCPFYYGRSLISIGPFISSSSKKYKNKGPNIEKMLNIDRKYCKVFADSGGYQIATGKIEYSDSLRELVFNWMNEYADIGLPIDIPPVVTTNAGDIATVQKQKHSLEQSIKNIKWVHDRLDKATCLYLNVQHGRDINYIESWYKKVKDFKGFKGWAIGSAGSSIFHIIYAILRMFENKEFENENNKIFHIFGVSTAKVIPIIIYLEKKIHDLGYTHARISFDSSTPLLQSAFGNFLIARNRNPSWSYLKIKNVYDFKPFKDKKIKMPCICPVCSQTSNIENWLDDEEMTTRSRWYAITALHNMYHMLSFIQGSESVIQLGFDEMKEDYLGREIISIFKLIDACFSSSKPTVYALNHKNVFQNTENQIMNVKRQASVLDF